jgi:CRISPR-associated endonuclease Csn1
MNMVCSYSAKAIKKLLPLMRVGKFWDEKAIHNQTKERIDKIINGEVDEKIQNQVREKAISLRDINHFKGLPIWLTSYIVYDRHSEEGDLVKWKTPADLERFLKEFKQHSLRNPIVEQVITETLRVVKDIWLSYGQGSENFFDEIHIELGREMKNDKKSRERITKQVTENENTNLRIKALLAEMINDSKVENVRPYSPSQQEILKIYEDGVLNSGIEIEDDILKISKTAQPSKNDLIRYKLWLEQKYRSPYTGEMIPLNKLFTTAYEIEHIIPQSRYFDDSFSNKVICESEVNKDKTNQTGFEYIQAKKGSKIELSGGKWITLFTEEQYEMFVKEYYAKSQGKMKKLLMLDIPEKMIERQMNDTRYISKEVKNLLSKIVRKEKNDVGTTSVNVLSSNGQITSTLKNDWGLNDVWNEIISPRFERLNAMTGNEGKFGKINENTQKFLPTVPLELQKGFSKKRIDHRHHAMDALVIACASRNHINYLNNQNALEKDKSKEQKQKKREDLRYLLCDKKYNDGSEKNYKWIFKKPWPTFTQNTREKLQTTVISFKKNLRVINKTVNKYQRWENKNGQLEKVIATQKGQNWAIRKSLHVPMPYGKKIYSFDILKIAENIGKRKSIIDNYIKDKVDEVYAQNGNKTTATQNYLKKNPIKGIDDKPVLTTAFKIDAEKFRKRQPISELSNRGQGGIKTTEDAIKYINKVADFKLQQDLLKHLQENNNDIEKAFSPDGIDNFNMKRKIPVYKLPIAESGDKRFPVGNSIGTRHKWMEAEKGTNLFFAVYKNEEGKRNYVSVPFNEALESQKQRAVLKQKTMSVPEKFIDEKTKQEHPLLFQLSPNDLVYLPTEEEREKPYAVDFEKLNKEQTRRVYKFVSCTGSEGHFVPHYYSSPIIKNEIGANNKSEKNVEGAQIKASGWKLEVDRLGKIKKAIK